MDLLVRKCREIKDFKVNGFQTPPELLAKYDAARAENTSLLLNAGMCVTNVKHIEGVKHIIIEGVPQKIKYLEP